MPKNRLVRALDLRKTARAAVTNVTGGGSTTVTLDHGTLTGLADDDHTQYLNTTRGDARYDARYVPLGRTVTAGSGLTGGGALSANITLNVGAGAGITVNDNDVALAAGVAGNGLTLTGGVLDVVGGNGLTVSANSMSVNAGNGLTFSSGALVVDPGPGLSINNSGKVRLDPVAAGAGLTHNVTTGALAVGAGTLIRVDADDINLSSGTAQYQVPVTGSTATDPDYAPSWTGLGTFAGNGLDFINGQFVVGQGAGLTVSSTTVALTQPGTLTVSTSNTASGNHTHQITSTSNATNASLLASDSNGYLRLVRLGLGMAPTRPLDVTGDAGFTGQVIAGSGAFSGTVNITNGGDLTVGSVLQVNTAGTRVGINRAPDQQFDLDVAGAIRGQYLIGKHAIQLASAIGVFHYDGAAPYRLDNTGSNNSHIGVGGTEAGGILYRPGKFGKAVQVAEATTNLVTNPSFETGNATGWTNYSTGSPTGTRTVVQGDVALYGDYAYEIKKTGGAAGAAYGTYFGFNVESGKTYTYSAWVKIATYSGGTGQVYVYGGGNIPPTTVSLSGTDREWQRATFTVTATGTGLSAIYCWINNADTMTLYLDGVQVEEKAYATAYCDGSLGTGHSWSGTAHASTSSRTGASLQYANRADLNPDEGSIMMWVRHESIRPVNSQGLFGAGAANAQFDAFVTNAGTITFRQAGTSLSFAAGMAAQTWYHLAFTWSRNGNTRKIFFNGAEVASRQFDTGASIGSTLWVGSLNVGGSGFNVNGLIDEFVLLEYPAEPKLIRAIYESDAPVFVESSVIHWRSPARVPIWVDEYGMWAKGVNGGEILGLYGGDPRNPTGNVTRSWGGITMEENDIVIGRVAGAVVDWDDSAGELLIGRPSASNLLLSGGLAQMRDGTTVYGQWSNSGLVIGRVANSTSRLEITSTGALNIINRSAGGSDTTAISLSNSGSASFTGSVTAASGSIGGWSLAASSLTSNNVGLYSGATGTARVQVGGSSTNYAGVSSVSAAGDFAFWAGQTHGSRSSAPFRVTAGGALTASGATISGALTATSGSFTGAVSIASGGSLTFGGGKGVLDNNGMYLVSDNASEFREDRNYAFRGPDSSLYGGLEAYYQAGTPSWMTLWADSNSIQNNEMKFIVRNDNTSAFLSLLATTTGSGSRLRFEAPVGTGLMTVNGSMATFGVDMTVNGDVTSTGNVTINKATPTLTLTPTSGYGSISLSSSNNGSSFGQVITIGRNSNATTPSTGILQIVNGAATPSTRNIWPSTTGVLRIGTTAPTNSNQDTTGAVVGDQTSHESYKTELGDATPIAEVLERIAAAAVHVKRFAYNPDVGLQGETFEGLILREAAPETHHYGQDKGETGYSAGKSLNIINVCGDLLRAVVYLNQRLEALH